jgi:hypothetical protein
MSMTTLNVNSLQNQTVERKLAGARFQIAMLERLLPDGDADIEAIESAVCGAIDQMLQSLTAALFGFNAQLPDPLVPQRVNRRNLRDQFRSVGISSAVLQEIERVNRVGDGWLWWLEQKSAGAAYRPLIIAEHDSIHLRRDPMNREAGAELADPVSYLQQSLKLMAELLDRLDTLVADDVRDYRAALRRDVRKLI